MTGEEEGESNEKEHDEERAKGEAKRENRREKGKNRDEVEERGPKMDGIRGREREGEGVESSLPCVQLPSQNLPVLNCRKLNPQPARRKGPSVSPLSNSSASGV